MTMPEIKFESEWLKAKSDVEHGDNIKFLDAGKEVEQKDGGFRWIFKVGIIKQGESKVYLEKKFTLNMANFDAIKEIYGTNSDEWVGKEMNVVIIKAQTPQGNTVDAIRLAQPGSRTQ